MRMKVFRGIAEGIWPYPGGRYTEKGWVWSRILEGILPQAVILTNRTTPASDKGRLILLRLCGYPAKGAGGCHPFPYGIASVMDMRIFYIFFRIFTKGVGMPPWNMCIILRNLFLQ